MATLSKPPLMAEISTPNGLTARSWSAWFRDLHSRTLVVSGATLTSTSVSITTADIGAAGATYSQAHAQAMANLTNENKAAINQLASDLNDTISTLNSILDKL